jgi:short subunit dehydrogenase-like uncharacterized protein
VQSDLEESLARDHHQRMIVLYGATGFTGSLIATELVRRHLEVVLGGRSRQRLEHLAEELGGLPVRVAAVDDATALRAMLEGCAVVINCAGPFTGMGEPVVRAAVEAGVHYVDSCGEQGFMQGVFEGWGEPARRAGVAVVPALGCNYALGDCIARIVADGVEPLDDVTIAYALEGVAASRGTMRSTVVKLRHRPIGYRDGSWRPAPRRARRGRFDFGDRLGVQTVASYPSGETVTVPRHTRTRSVTTLISTRSLLPAGPPALLPPALAVIGAMARTPMRRVLERLVDRLPAGPTAERRAQSVCTVVAVARGADGRRRRGVVSGGDMYGLTAVSIAEGAERLLAGRHRDVGALGPAAAFDPREFLDALADAGMHWSLEPG